MNFYVVFVFNRTMVYANSPVASARATNLLLIILYQ